MLLGTIFGVRLCVCVCSLQFYSLKLHYTMQGSDVKCYPILNYKVSKIMLRYLSVAVLLRVCKKMTGLASSKQEQFAV